MIFRPAVQLAFICVATAAFAWADQRQTEEGRPELGKLFARLDELQGQNKKALDLPAAREAGANRHEQLIQAEAAADLQRDERRKSRIRLRARTSTSWPSPPAGFVWLFPSRAHDPRIAVMDPPHLTDSERQARELESARRAKAIWPFVADTSDPRRQQFDVFVAKYRDHPDYQTLFSLTQWPELAARECGQEFEWGSHPRAGK